MSCTMVTASLLMQPQSSLLAVMTDASLSSMSLEVFSGAAETLGKACLPFQVMISKAPA